MGQQQGAYFVPSKSQWPIVAAVVMFVTVYGAAHWLNAEPGESGFGKTVLLIGALGILAMFFGWFRSVIKESLAGNYNDQVDRSFRMGMMWFIFSEVMFFGAFFGALWYARSYSVPWLGGEGHGVLTHQFLWSQYSAAWGATGGNGPEHVGGDFQTIAPWGLPLLNTLILLSSSVTITIAHHALKAGHRGKVLLFLGLTVLLGATFLWFQAHEYIEAYKELNLTLQSGVYGSTFFMLTGFHGMHVTLGTIMLAVIWLRVLKGHFNKDHHFGFEAVAWYWHFVDVVWLGLFMFVYIL
ncbi:cytochrome c oxidase subunit 3 [Fulvimonas soli]|jgi:cytochrome c oxidase subunit 3|uniref:cytochrome-c oxidase n=1 Tax=Fulvimonas soli TaxID=155197 RepID=A0A316IHT1_9GAMM|nr:cytochrome c oxidase subunit 3 [Fulvimonas soli]PWK86805.1 cytochrome c oxidase subunit 3 [Fulvimonas soli]TNY27183.1 cytochrome c oxidase subunit 3 [Fulvimonas soli]